ncbi:MAG: hypothetical protein IKU47_02075 [Oscillospiraceae bacterium]|nr:hypothetical protein [Oscillospiraceae bacterium]
MDYREYFIVKNMYNSAGNHYIDQYDDLAIERDVEFSNRIKDMFSAYLIVTISTDLSWYNTENLYGAPGRYGTSIFRSSFKPETPYMTMAVLKVVDYKPLSRIAENFKTSKTFMPSLKLRTMDGREIDGYSEYIKDGKQYVVLSDDVLGEVEKNFVYPKLNFQNFQKFADTNEVGDEAKFGSVNILFCAKTHAKYAYEHWNDNKYAMEDHFFYLIEVLEEKYGEDIECVHLIPYKALEERYELAKVLNKKHKMKKDNPVDRDFWF